MINFVQREYRKWQIIYLHVFQNSDNYKTKQTNKTGGKRLTKKKHKLFVIFGFMLIFAASLFMGGEIYSCTISAAANDECRHEYETTEVKATCNEMGYTLFTCIICGDAYRDNFTNFKEHNFIQIEIEPTCVERGKTTHLCMDCGYTYTDNVIMAYGHSYEAETHGATCIEDGYTQYICLNCGDSFTDNIVAATGHEYKDKIVNATCTAYGFTVHECGICGDRYIDGYVRPIGHNFVVTVIDATAEIVGYTHYVCTDCGYGYLSDFVRSGETPAFHDEESSYESSSESEEKPTSSEEPGEHSHTYYLYYELHEDGKYFYIKYFCPECDDVKNETVSITMTADSGNRFDLNADEYGNVRYEDIPFGNYYVEIFDENGRTISWFPVVISEELPGDTSQEQESKSEGENNSEDERTSESGQALTVDSGKKQSAYEEESNLSDKGEKNTNSDKDTGNSSLLTGIIIALAVLAAGAVATLMIIKKRNKK